MESYPWAREYLNDRTTPRRTGGASSAAAPAAPPEVTDEVIEEAWAALEAKRRQWSLEEEREGEDFTTNILGGEWTRKHKGKAFDAIKSAAGGGAPSLWCRLYGLNVEAPFSFNKFGEAAASTLALQWCKRMQHFYNIYLRHDAPEYVYSDKELESFQEDEEWVAFVRDASAKPETWKRAVKIRSVRPSKAPTAGGGSATPASSSSRARG